MNEERDGQNGIDTIMAVTRLKQSLQTGNFHANKEINVNGLGSRAQTISVVVAWYTNTQW